MSWSLEPAGKADIDELMTWFPDAPMPDKCFYLTRPLN